MLSSILDNATGLAPIFSLNVTSGKLTVDATGPHLIGKGVPLGVLTVSYYIPNGRTSFIFTHNLSCIFITHTHYTHIG